MAHAIILLQNHLTFSTVIAFVGFMYQTVLVLEQWANHQTVVTLENQRGTGNISVVVTFEIPISKLPPELHAANVTSSTSESCTLKQNSPSLRHLIHLMRETVYNQYDKKLCKTCDIIFLDQNNVYIVFSNFAMENGLPTIDFANYKYFFTVNYGIDLKELNLILSSSVYDIPCREKKRLKTMYLEFEFTLVEYSLLPKPYKTNCRNYDKSGLFSQCNCFHACLRPQEGH